MYLYVYDIIYTSFIRHKDRQFYRSETPLNADLRAQVAGGLVTGVLPEVDLYGVEEEGDAHEHSDGDEVAHCGAEGRSHERVTDGDVALHTEREHEQETEVLGREVDQRERLAEERNL